MQMRRRNMLQARCTVVSLWAASWFVFVPPPALSEDVTEAGTGSAALTKDELLNRLRTRQAQLALDRTEAEMKRAKAEHEETRRLFDEKIVTVDDLNKARQAYEQAVLEYEQAKIELEKTRLEFLKDATLITVVDARKYRTDEGQIMASVTLRNDSDIAKARIAMGENVEIPDEELAALLKIDNLIVTLRGTTRLAQGPNEDVRSVMAIVGDPFQQIIPELKHGETVTVKYALLKRDVEDVAIEIEFLGAKKEYTVFLKKEAQQDLPTIASTQYAQQGQLGTKIRYDLDLERLAKTEQSFSLVVLNLPSAISFAFLDPASKAQITQLKFTSEISRQSLDFEISIPEKLGADLIDRNISFYILVTKQAEMKTIYGLTRNYEGQEIPAEEIAKLKGNKVNLILIPKGTPKVQMVVPNLFKEVQEGQPVELKFNVVNSGTLVLRAVTPAIDLPLEWEAELNPGEVEVLDPGEKRLITVNILPPPGTVIGEYTMVLNCKGHSGIETVEAVQKDFKVRVAPKSRLTSTLVLVIILVGLVLFIAIASVKISRR